MNYNIITDKIEVRSLKEGNQPRYIVRGTAMVANKKDIYQYSKNPDGTFKTLHSLFTPACIRSVKEQAKHKRLFVDSQHELALNANIKSILKGKLSSEEDKRIEAMLKTKMLPFAKLNDIEIKDNMLDIETEVNSMFREVDADHKNYFDAVWYSLEHKYLNGISVNFANPQIIYENGEPKIDNIDVLGFSYVDAPALSDNSIYEVAIRAMQEGISVRAGEKMEDEKNKLELEKSKLDEERRQIDREKAELIKQKEESAKRAEIEKQATEQKKIQDELQVKADEAKRLAEENIKLKDEMNSIKGTVKNKGNPNQSGEGSKFGEGFYKEKLKEITSEHDKTIETLKSGKQPMIDKTMKGFAELVNLGAKANNPTADLDDKNAEYIREHKLLAVSGADIIVPRNR